MFLLTYAVVEVLDSTPVSLYKDKYSNYNPLKKSLGQL